MKLKIAFHAFVRMAQRGFTEKDIRQVIGKGQKRFEKRSNRWHAKMGGIEVVYEIEMDKIIVVTCYWD